MATGSGWAEALVGLPGRTTGALFSSAANAGFNAANKPKMSIWVSVAGYILAIAIILAIILLFVHFTIRPIFQFTPGGAGVIPIPGFSDSKLYWKKAKDVAILNETAMGINAIPIQNWSFTLDIFIKNPTTLQSGNIPIFQREELLTTTPTGPGRSNVHVFLVPGTNDLIVGVTNAVNNVEDVVLSNVPVQTPFRVGVVILDVAMEVYVNGRLMKTRTFDAPPGNFVGKFAPPQGSAADLVKVRNLQIWTRPTTASEIRYARPALMSASEFQHDKMDSASSCAANLEKDAVSSLTSAANSLSSLTGAPVSGNSLTDKL